MTAAVDYDANNFQFYQDSWLYLVDAIASLIDEDSDFVFDALDGKFETSGSGAEAANTSGGAPSQRRNSEINYREEPVAFFFVLFGLVFEALVQRPSSPSSSDGITTSSRTLEVLLALKRILRPSVSGNAIYQDAVFTETMDVLDRMVLTESKDVQTVIVEIARNLCVGHPSSRHGVEEENDHLSDDIEQLFELTRIIVLVLAGIIPGLGEAGRTGQSTMTDESISLAVLSLESLVTASSVFPSIIKSDLHACIFHIFTVILSSPPCQLALVPQALPIFRRFMVDLVSAGDLRSESKKQVRATLSRFLVVLKNAQKREAENSLAAEKNTLLAGTMLITSISTAFIDKDSKAPDVTLTRFLAALSDALDNRMTTKMAAGCTRSLLLMPARSPIVAHVHAALLPKSLFFLSHPNLELEELAPSRTLLAATVTGFVTSSLAASPPRAKAAAMSVVVTALLTRAQAEGEAVVGRETSQRVLELAGSDAVAFRAAVGRLDGPLKTLLQGILSSAGGRGRAGDVADEGADEDGDEGKGPSIELKMNF